MTTTEMITALAGGGKARRPSWPAGEYVEAEGAGAMRKVSQSTMMYSGSGGVRRWVLMPGYDIDFYADDFELL